MQMIGNYEEIKTEIVNSNYKSLKNITFQFHECNSIELQKKILILLLKKVRKTVLKRYGVLGEYNLKLIKINPKKLKEEIHEFLYSIYNSKEDNTTFILSSISATKWKSINFLGQHIKTTEGYVFLDRINLVFYCPTENFVIDIQSILSIRKESLSFVLSLKEDKEFSFELLKEAEMFEMKLRETFKFEDVIDEKIESNNHMFEEQIIKDIPIDSQIEISSSTNNNRLSECGNLKVVDLDSNINCEESSKESSNISLENLQDKPSEKENQRPRRSSLNQKKLAFNSECISNFGNNLQIKIKKPAKELFSHNQAEEMKSKIIAPKIEDSKKKTSKIKKQEKVEKHQEKVKKLNMKKKRNFSKHIKIFIKRFTKSKLENLRNEVKKEVANIKLRGRALKGIIEVFIRKYVSAIKIIQ